MTVWPPIGEISLVRGLQNWVSQAIAPIEDNRPLLPVVKSSVSLLAKLCSSCLSLSSTRSGFTRPKYIGFVSELVSTFYCVILNTLSVTMPLTLLKVLLLVSRFFGLLLALLLAYEADRRI